MSLQENQEAKKFLVFEDQFKQYTRYQKVPSLYKSKDYWLWSDRLVLIEDDHDEEFWNFVIFDLLMNEERPARLPKSNTEYTDIYVFLLPNHQGFIVEHSSSITHTIDISINFMQIDWDTANLLVRREIFTRQCRFLWLFVNRFDAKKLVIQCVKNENLSMNIYETFNLTKKRGLEFDEELYWTRTNFYLYFEDKLIGVKKPSITLYDFNTKKEEQAYHIDSSLFESGVVAWDRFGEWVQDRVYISVKIFGTIQSHGIAWTDLKIKRWTLLKNFLTNLEIRDFEFVNGNLLVFAEKHEEKWILKEPKVKGYVIPMRRPQLLRKTAWILVVNVMKNRGEKDPYKEAKEFLPLNSDLRSFWFKDEEKTIEEGVPIKKLKPN